MFKKSYSIALFNKRLLVLFSLITFFFLLCVFKVGFVQLINGQSLQILATDQWTRDVPVKAKRGTIYDSLGAVLAQSELTYDVYVRHKNVKDSLFVAKSLSESLDLQFEEVYNKVLDDTLSEIVIKLNVETEKVKDLISKNAQGVVFSESYKRVYPYNNLLTQVLGFTSSDGSGQFGIESYYDKILQGTNGTILTQSDVKGKNIENSLEYYIQSSPGYNITLTINHYIQQFLESALIDCINEQKASKAMGVVMDVQTGEILAMSCKPSFNLNAVPRNDIQTLLEESKNMLITDIYEPGSTFKILTSAIALNEGLVSEQEMFYDPGYRIVDGEKIKCWKLIGHGSETFRDGFCNSCNSVYIDLALRLGVDKFYERLQEFGLDCYTGIDFQGEVCGIMMNKQNVKNVDLARVGFGQAIAVTPIELITALSACVNGGKLLTPYLVKNISDCNGIILKETTTSVKAQVVSEEVSKLICSFLEDAVGRPNGNYTFIPGYSVGGKTGTTQKYENGKISGEYIASFFGIYPCNNPQYAILFIVDEPKGSSYYGSIVATPYAKKVLEGIISYLGDERVLDVSIDKIEMPNLIGLSLLDAVKELSRLNLNYEMVGEGGYVVEQFPLFGEQINCNQTVQITLK